MDKPYPPLSLIELSEQSDFGIRLTPAPEMWEWLQSQILADVTKIACAIAVPLLMSAYQSSSTQPTLPKAAACQPPTPPVAWIMQPYEPDLTQRMLNELSPSPSPSPSPTPATGDRGLIALQACQSYVKALLK